MKSSRIKEKSWIYSIRFIKEIERFRKKFSRRHSCPNIMTGTHNNVVVNNDSTKKSWVNFQSNSAPCLDFRKPVDVFGRFNSPKLADQPEKNVVHFQKLVIQSSGNLKTILVFFGWKKRVNSPKKALFLLKSHKLEQQRVAVMWCRVTTYSCQVKSR